MLARAAVIAALSLGAALPVRASTSPILTARPTSNLTTLKPGVTVLAKGAIAYLPERSPDGPRPLLVLLRGALGNASGPIDYFRPLADRNGWLLLAPEAADGTWRIRPIRERKADYGADPSRIDAALHDLFAKTSVNPGKVVLVGFSDGASYALSLGLANPELFRGIAAFSPGYAWLPDGYDTKQRIFISHGLSDEVLPPANVRERILPGLKLVGFEPRMRWFEGGHTIDRAALEEGLAFVLDGR